MFDGLNNNRVHWKERADIYQAKVDALENERKRLEEEEAKKGALTFFVTQRYLTRIDTKKWRKKREETCIDANL